MPSLKASEPGLAKIKQARNNKGWNVEDEKWLIKASEVLEPDKIWPMETEKGELYAIGVSLATWKRFLQGKERINTEVFKAFCQVLGLNWEEIRDRSSTQPTDALALDSTSDDGQIPQEFDDGETRWVGRETLINSLIQKLQGDCRVLSIVGITGIGKTSLAAKLMREPEILHLLPVLKAVSFYQESPKFEELARQVLGGRAIKDEQLHQNSDALVNAIVMKLQSQPCLLVIDMVEEVLEADGKGGHQFKEQTVAKFLDRIVRADRMLARIILTSQDQPPVIAEGRYPERSHTESLKGLSDSEAKELFKVWDVRIQEDADLDYLNRIISVYEGHPLALKVIAGEIRDEPYQGDVQAYWNDYGHEIEEVERMKNAPEPSSREDKPRLDRYSTKLTDLVQTRIEKTFERLHKAYPVACLLFCMGATNRRATERRAWLFLIGEYPREEQESAFQTLERRLLLETEKQAKKIFYRLHSLNRRVALDNLPKLEEEVLLA